MTVNNEPIILAQTFNVSVKNGWTYFIKQHLKNFLETKT